jgi:hypothetical protein
VKRAEFEGEDGGRYISSKTHEVVTSLNISALFVVIYYTIG